MAKISRQYLFIGIIILLLSMVGLIFLKQKNVLATTAAKYGFKMVYRLDGEALHDYFGQTVGTIGDQDGDSREDILVNGPSTNPGGKTKAGTVYVYSSATGNLIRKFDGLAENDGLGVGAMSGVGDQDGDSREELLVGASGADPGGKSNAGSAYIYSIATGNLIRQFDGATADDLFGSSVTSVSDMDGDSKKEIVVCAYGVHDGAKADTGAVYIYSSITGNLLRAIYGPNANDKIGTCITVINDQNGDGSQEIVVGAPLSSPGGKASAGTVLVYSPKDGSLIRSYPGEAAGDFFGFSISEISDLNGDGKNEIIVGAPYTDPGGKNGAGSVYIFSTTTGVYLLKINGTLSNTNLGYSVSFVGDQNGDGKEDVLVGAPSPSSQNYSYIFSSQTGQVLKSFTVSGANLFGIDVAATNNANGKQNIIIGDKSFTATEEWQGAAFVYALYTFQNIGNFSWSKGTSLTNAFNLNDYFFDSSESGTVYYASGNDQIRISIDENSHEVSFTSPSCWIGSETVAFHAVTSNGLHLISNPVVLTVSDARVDSCNPSTTVLSTPSISIDYPYFSDWQTYASEINIRGTASDTGSGLDKAWLYNQTTGETINLENISPGGYFEQGINLQKNSKNIIQVKAQNKIGRTAVKEFRIQQLSFSAGEKYLEVVQAAQLAPTISKMSILDETLNEEVELNADKEIIIYTQKPLIKGTTIPLGEVDIYINSSQEIHGSIEADATGNWQYQLTQPLEYGRHIVYATVTNQDGRVSQQTDQVVFTVREPLEVPLAQKVEKTLEKKSNWWPVLIGGLVVVVGLVVISLVLAKRRKKSGEFQSPNY